MICGRRTIIWFCYYLFPVKMILGASSPPSDLVDPDYSFVKTGFHDEHILFTKSDGYTDLNFMPDNKGLLVNEKDGVVRFFDDFQNSDNRKVALDISDKVCDNNERGLHTLTLHPDFKDNGYLYLFYTYAKYGNCNDEGPVNIFSRFQYDFETNEIDRGSEKILIESVSVYRNYHNGGGTAFGPDGYIYVAIGDGGYKNKDVTLTPSNLQGSILRITDDGGIPADNPYANHPDAVECALAGGKSKSLDIPCKEVFATGVRNPFNLVMNPYPEKNDEVHFYFNDVGSASWEEINEGGTSFKGVSYGWQYKEGPCVHKVVDDNYVCDVLDNVADQINKEPIHWYTHGQEFSGTLVSRAAIGATFVPVEAGWPEMYDGSYIWIEYRLGIHHLKYTGAEDRDVFPPISNYEAVPLRYIERPIRMKFGPCDSCSTPVALYYLVRESAGELRRFTYVGDDVNRSPIISFHVLLEKGGTGLSISLDASDSYDPDGEEKDVTDLTFSWDFGDNSPTVITNNLPTTTYQYKTKGRYEVSLTVTDKLGKSSTATKSIDVGIDNLNELVNFEWKSKESDNDCANDGYDYCGIMEFCYQETEDEDAMDIYGYRIPCDSKDDECDKTCKPGPGPVIRMEAGKRYKFTLSNTAPASSTSGGSDHHPTNIHTHGLHIVGAGDSDDVTRIVDGGNCLDYTWDIPHDHPDGTYWYHPHYHGSSETQVSGGAFGLLIIENNVNLHGNVMPDWTFNERLLQISRIDDIVLGNGNFQEPIYMDAQQWYRLRISVVDPDGEAQLLDFGEGCDVHKVASDGVWHSTVPFESSQKISQFELTGASRADFAVRCYDENSSAVGESTVNIMFADEIVGVIHVGESTGTPFELTTWSPGLPESLQGIASAIVSDENKFDVEIGRATINGLEWDADVPLKTISYDSVHEWNLSDSRDHPFHTHLYHMMVVTPGGCGAHKEGEFYDTIAGPPCTVRFKTADIGQRFVFHCHVLSHGDSGSMGWIDVQGPGMPLNNADSHQYACGPSPQPTLSPTKSPVVVSPTFEPTQCLPMPLLSSSSIIEAGANHIIFYPEFNLHLRQNFNGNLVLRAGHPDDEVRGEIFWESKYISEESGDYYTVLGTNGELVTFQGTPDDSGDKVWSTDFSGVEGVYFFALNCDETVSIYRGKSDERKGMIVWPPVPTISPMPSYPKKPSASPSQSLSETVTETPTSASPTECLPITLLTSPSVIQAGGKHIKRYDNFDFYMKQTFEGNLVVRRGHPNDQIKGDIIWDSNIFDEEGNYFSVLNTYGELSTFKGTPDNVGEKVWGTDYIGSEGDYFFALTCNRTVAVFKGLPEDHSGTVWPSFGTSEPPVSTSSPTLEFSKQSVSPTLDTVPNPSAVPTIIQVDTTTDPPSSKDTPNPTGLPTPTTRNPTSIPTEHPTDFPTNNDMISLIECQGDCNSDDDCVGDLVCFQLDGTETTDDLPCESAITRAFQSVCYSPINVSPRPTIVPSEMPVVVTASGAPHQTGLTFTNAVLLVLLLASLVA